MPDGIGNPDRPLFERRTRVVDAVEWGLALIPLVFFLLGLVIPK
jgi:hypothetical protein